MIRLLDKVKGTETTQEVSVEVKFPDPTETWGEEIITA